MKRTWFITGASRGFGRIWAEAALRRGDEVAATTRKLADVADLTERSSSRSLDEGPLSLALDVTDREPVRQADGGMVKRVTKGVAANHSSRAHDHNTSLP